MKLDRIVRGGNVVTPAGTFTGDVGIAGEKYFEVQSGLKPGEKIVAGTYQAIRELKDGTTIRETKAETPKPVTKS